MAKATMKTLIGMMDEIGRVEAVIRETPYLCHNMLCNADNCPLMIAEEVHTYHCFNNQIRALVETARHNIQAQMDELTRPTQSCKWVKSFQDGHIEIDGVTYQEV